MDEKNGVESECNNNIGILLKPDITLSVSIHYVSLTSVSPAYKRFLFTFLKDTGFRMVSDLKPEKGNFLHRRTYDRDIDNVTFEIYYGFRRDIKARPTLLITYRDPNKDVTSALTSFFDEHGIVPTVSKLEISFDFVTTENRIPLLDFILDHLYLRHQRISRKNPETTSSKMVKTTFYTNHLGKTLTKGMRLYLKQWEDGKKAVRLELVLKRPLLRRLKIGFPFDLASLPNYGKFFAFMELDEKALRRYLIWKNRESIREANARRPGYGDLVIRQIESWLITFIKNQESLMGKIEVLKSPDNGIPNFRRFLKPVENFSERQIIKMNK